VGQAVACHQLGASYQLAPHTIRQRRLDVRLSRAVNSRRLVSSVADKGSDPLAFMRAIQSSRDIVIGAPAKVNLFLELLGKRPDGYHELATLMVGLSFRDTLAFADRPNGEISLTCNRPELSTGPDNLIVKAARLLQAKTGCPKGSAIRLAKRIPMAAGLAGGSTDAAATLVALNRLWNTGLTSGELAELAAKLGSDVAFFLSLPAAWCTGRGEIVTPLALPKSLDLVLIFPPVGCDTASVYRHATVPSQPVDGAAVRQAFTDGDVEALSRVLHNRLESAAEIVVPRVLELRQAVGRVAPLGCRMSGSGSTLFTLARNRTEALALAKRLQALPELAGCGVRAVRTLNSSRTS
jgi:4-diphosphocytidyl-2-C-methyl-D-erythritol kinase